jgi:hypothetical protein
MVERVWHHEHADRVLKKMLLVGTLLNRGLGNVALMPVTGLIALGGVDTV